MTLNREDHAKSDGAAALTRALAGARPVGDGMTPFDRADWYAALHAACWPGEPVLAPSATAAGTTATLVLREPARGHFESCAHWYSFLHRPLFSGGDAPDAALTALARALRRRAATVTLRPVPERDGSARRIAAAFRAGGWVVRREAASVSHWLDLNGLDFDGWWASRPGALRSTVARKGRKGIVDLSLVDRFDADVWAAYETIYAASWKPSEGHPAFLRDFAMAEGAAGRLRLGLARIDGAPVAAQFWTVEDGAAFIHKLAHLEDRVAASPGTLLSHALFRHVIERDRVTRVDFGTGDDRYKRDWMNRRDPLWRFAMYNPARIGAWPGLVRGWLRAVKGKGSE